jgi:hypothetical protein
MINEQAARNSAASPAGSVADVDALMRVSAARQSANRA